MNFLRNRRKTRPRVNVGNWIEAGCCVSITALVVGWGAAFLTGETWMAVPALIPAALVSLAAHFHNWEREI